MMTTTKQFEKMSDEELKKKHDNQKGRCSYHTKWIFAMVQQAGQATFEMRSRDSGGHHRVASAYRSDITTIRDRMASIEKMLKDIEKELRDMERLEDVWSARWKAKREAQEDVE